MSLLNRVVLILGLLSVVSSSALAQFPMPMNRPEEDTQPAQIRELVSKYCRLDYEGARLDPQAWPKFQSLVWWQSDPGYNQINVVARYSVEAPPASSHGKYLVTVQYRLLGVYDLSNGYMPEPTGTTQNVDFSVSSEDNQWRIADAENTLPHPSRAAMLKWLNEKLNSTQDEAAKTRYQGALKLLQAQSASPFAK